MSGTCALDLVHEVPQETFVRVLRFLTMMLIAIMMMMMIITCVMIMMMKLMTIKIVAIYNYDENDDDNPQGEAALCLYPHSDHACQPQVNHRSHHVDHHSHCVDHHFHSKLTILFESSESFFPAEQTILPPSSSPTRT